MRGSLHLAKKHVV